jgi:tRNA1(Val) A37 N6-methylase TrmN6
MNDQIIQAGSEDRILGGRVILQQPETGYRAAIDPVLLAAACPATDSELVLDAGCGVGAAGLSVVIRTGCRAIGLELQPALAALAQENGMKNRLGDRWQALEGSILAPPAALKDIRFDHVIVNPPYLPDGYGSGETSLANHEGEARLKDWVDFAVVRVKHGGSIVFIHRADRLDEILTLFSGRIGATVILPLWRRAGDEARRIIVGGIKGRKTPLRLLPGLDLHETDGRFTKGAEAILRDAQPIKLW